MFIKSIVLEGFKSYGNRVEITGFDPEFNAITGLNGTGKSNILDSICFVLGITNLSNMRAGNLQELIYKNGQTGITKTTVSITFDNKDKRQSPIGYENQDEITVSRQVVMGGKNKYLINGINVQNKRVSDLFCSVQLNINNPHFLIMQGRITKVLNMKPQEILSMVEEAAGTRMYEAKKQAAQKTIERKDAKLRELNDIIQEDITPRLQKLQEERAQYQEYQKVVRELDSLTKLVAAYAYVTAEQKVAEAESKVKAVEEEVRSKQRTIVDNEKQAKDLDKQVALLNRRLDEENANAMEQLEGEVQRLEREEAGAGADERAARDGLAGQRARAGLLRAALGDDRAALAARAADLRQISTTFENLRATSETSSNALAEAQQRFLAVSSGLEGGSESLQDQLMEAKRCAAEAGARASAAAMERRHAAARLRALEQEARGGGEQLERDRAHIARLQAQLDALQAELPALAGGPARLQALAARARGLRAARARGGDALDALGARLQRCHFKYTPPEQNFAHSRVFGTVCRLIDVCDPIYCTALETAAGGRLYNVVVDTEVTSKMLLQHGQLQTRTTIIPLNKISGHVIDPNTVRIAQEIGGGPQNVQLALELVSFASRLRPAMQWVFGGTLVCRDLDTAKRVTFDPRVRSRCVTLDGDVFDPSGTLSGGARVKGGSVLLQLQELKKLEQESRATEEQLQQLAGELAEARAAADAYSSKNERFEMMSHELEAVKARLAATTYAQTQAEIESLRAQVSSLSADIERAERERAAAEDSARALALTLGDLRGHRDREFKKAEEALKKAKLDAENHGSAWKQREQELETLKMEVSELEQAVVASERLLQETSAAAEGLQAELDGAAERHRLASEAVKQQQEQLKKHKLEVINRNSDIAQLVLKKEQLQKTNGDLGLVIKELDYKIKELQTEATECVTKMEALAAQHAWIAEERAFFGAAGGQFDWAARDAGAAAARRAQLDGRRARLARGLNARAHALLAAEDDHFQDLLRKRAIVEADRTKLIEVMAELDEKKHVALLTACKEVNVNFGSIFGSLLPGAQAELRAPPGGGVLDGLEVRVGFNATWKESLGELSGGQRSLVALSLVLAMLLFKPAPLYILDEVDAALDLSHTQNIGQMLKAHFRHSQFIIVSLKDGMFNNANVLFRTRFVDGMSSVQRIVNNRNRT